MEKNNRRQRKQNRRTTADNRLSTFDDGTILDPGNRNRVNTFGYNFLTKHKNSTRLIATCSLEPKL